MDDPDEPARRLQPERRRHGLLQQRAAGHDGGAMLLGELRARARHAVELGDDDRRRVARDERGRGVEDVLARRAAMHVTRALAQPSHERLDGIAGAAAVANELARRPARPTAKTSSPRSSACARASARSAASIARSHASSSSAARSSSGTNSASNGKEHRLPLALQADVEAERAVLLFARRTDRMRVSWCLSKPRAKTYASTCGVSGATRNEKRPSASVPQRPHSRFAASKISITPSTTGSSCPSSSRPTSAHAVRHQLVLRPPAEPDREERPDGLRRRARKRHVSTAASPRRGRCPTGSRAPTPAASSRGRSARRAARATSGRARR